MIRNPVLKNNSPAAVVILSGFAAVLWLACSAGAADSRFAHSDSDARFLHHIDLYDIDNRKITPESDRPYSSTKTCGRCHDYETISHGWHFNAFDRNSVAGRQGEPWIWVDARTGTQLPMSYRRKWSGMSHPDDLGITPWEMTKQFGARTPGGSMGTASVAKLKTPDGEESTDEESDDLELQRWDISGSLEIDCMICHAVSGAYDFNVRRDQIAEENFAWAATAAIRLGTVDGKASKIKSGSDLKDEKIQSKIPKVAYDAIRFASDGTVFMDLIREPDSNACFQCHSNRTVTDTGIEPRWVHDDDVHLRAGMQCVDCHRNGIDHHIVRGFEDEENPSATTAETLSCAGCHLGAEHDGDIHDEGLTGQLVSRGGRLGSPHPAHEGLPPIHFEKLSCTACHGGPAPRDEAIRIMTSLAHGLGSKDHRSGAELPAIAGPVYTKGADGRVYPQRAMWPAGWGLLVDGKIQPLPPEEVYDLTRRDLRVRKDLVSELLESKDNEPLDRSKFDEKVSSAIEAIEKAKDGNQAVYFSSGVVYTRGEEAKTLRTIELADDAMTKMLTWPIAHNVRPAGWSLGVTGCVECHSEEGKIFASTVASIGPGPVSGPPVSMATLQGIDPNQRLAWNQLFSGRKMFKYVIGTSIAILLMTIFIGIGALTTNLRVKR